MIGVREATPEDTEAIVSVTAQGWRRGYRGIVEPERLAELPVERWRHEVGLGLRRPEADSFTCVAEAGGEVAGYCYVAAPAREPSLGPGYAELVAIYVSPEHWGEGAGSALMEAALERLTALPYTDVFLWTFAENDRATGFYRRHGWQPDGAEKLHPRAGARAIRFRRAIESAQ